MIDRGALIEKISALLGPEMKAKLIAMVSAVAALAGCPLHGDGNHAVVLDQPAIEAPLGEQIGCALAGASQFTQDCALERAAGGEARLLVVRHPDGGFRRFVLGRDGKSISVADGAQPALGTGSGGVFEVRVGQDAYRIPVRPPAGLAE